MAEHLNEQQGNFPLYHRSEEEVSPCVPWACFCMADTTSRALPVTQRDATRKFRCCLCKLTRTGKIRLQNKQIDKISAHLKSICLEITKNYLNILVLVMEIIRVREAKLRTMKSTIEKAEQYVASKLP
jgi:hypothetical protein